MNRDISVEIFTDVQGNGNSDERVHEDKADKKCPAVGFKGNIAENHAFQTLGTHGYHVSKVCENK